MNSLEQFALQWLQTQLREILAADQDFPASLPLADLPGKPKIRWLYAALRSRRIDLPPLFLSRVQHRLLAVVALSVLATGLSVALRMQPIESGNIGGAFVACFATWAILAIITKQFFAQVSSADHVGELAVQIFAKNPLFFSRLSGQPLSRAQVREIVTRVLIDTCGVDRSEVTPDTRLADILK
jgi:hypothetical protein